MRELSATLKAAQQAGAINALVKIVLTYGANSYTYTKPRILSTKETEDGSLQYIEILLDNSDRTLTELDLQGYQAALSFGVATTAGDEYSQCAAMWVLAQQFDSDPNKLTCTLSVIGICNLMSLDKATATYMPDEDNDKTVKELVNSLLSASLGFTGCKSWQVVWEDGYDTLADTYKPKDSFRVYEGNNRMSAINRLLEFTLNVAVAKNDGKVHIFKPTTSGETYDYQYSLDRGQHQFFSKALRNRLVIPNKIRVRSQVDDSPYYEGEAIDTESHDKLPKVESHRMRLESDDQATTIAEAILAKVQMWCEAGAASVPLNVGTEAFDYVKVTDPRESDYRVGNIGRFVRHYDVRKNEWRMAFDFGNWQNVRKALDQLGITGDDIENYFSRLKVGDLYVENILADNVDFVWIDEDNNIDLDKIGDTIDHLADGIYYYRARTMHLDGETGITMWEGMRYYIRFSTDSDEAGIRRQDTPPGGVDVGEYWIDTSGEDPIIKRWTGAAWFTIAQWEIDALNKGLLTSHTKLLSLSVDGLVLLDKVEIGADYDLLYKADISAHHVLLSKTTKDGAWYEEQGVGIDADRGIGIYGGEGLMGLRTYPTLQDYHDDTNVRCYVGTDGKLCINGPGSLRFYLDALYAGCLGISDTSPYEFCVLAMGGNPLLLGTEIASGANILLDPDGGYVLPCNDNEISLGSSSHKWAEGHFHKLHASSRFQVPVGTDMYD